jgi:hypothetical protein
MMRIGIGSSAMFTSSKSIHLATSTSWKISCSSQTVRKGFWKPSGPGSLARHLVENFKTKFKHPKLAELLWKAARATTVADFDDVLCQMREINSQCVIWLEANAHPRYWATVYFRGHRWGHLTSNISESLNFMLNKARDLPCQPMLEIIRETMMDKWTEGREYAAKHQDLPLVIEVNSLF